MAFSYLGQCGLSPGNLSWWGLQGLRRGETSGPGNLQRASPTEEALSGMLLGILWGLHSPWSIWGLDLSPGPTQAGASAGCHYIV